MTKNKTIRVRMDLRQYNPRHLKQQNRFFSQGILTFFVFFYLFFWNATLSFAQNIITLDETQQERINLTEKSYWLESDAETLDAVLTHDQLFLFTPIRKNYFDTEKSTKSIWMKFSIKNNGNASISRIIEINPALLIDLEIFSLPKKKLEKIEFDKDYQERKKENFHQRYQEKTNQFSSHSLAIELLPNEERVFFIRTKPIPKMSYFLTLETNQSFFTKMSINQISIGLMLGWMFIMSLYHFFLFAQRKKIGFLLYGITFFLCTLSNFSQAGLGQIFFHISAEIGIRLSLIMVHLTISAAMFLALSIFYNLQSNRHIDFSFTACTVLHIIFIPLIPYFPISHLTESTVILTFFSIILSFVRYFKYPSVDKTAGYLYLIAKTAIFIPVIVVWNTMYGDYELYLSIAHFSCIASCIDAILLSFVLQLIYKEKNKEHEKTENKNLKLELQSANSFKIKSMFNSFTNNHFTLLDLLKNTELSQLQKEYVFLLNQSVHELNDANQFNHKEKPQGKIKETFFNLRLLVEKILKTEKINSEKITFMLDWEQGLDATRHGDKNKMTQILINVISIAKEKTAADQITIKITAGSHSNEIIFSIFSGKSQPNIGEIVETQHEVSLNKKLRSYLMFSAEKIIQTLNGQLEISENKETRTIWFNLHLEPALFEQTDNIFDDQLKRNRVLISDLNTTSDSEIYRYLTESWGMQTVVATKASETIALLKIHLNAEEPFDFILFLCDQKEGDLSNLINKIYQRKNELFKRIKIFVITQQSCVAALKQQHRNGLIQLIMTKPVSSETLKSELKLACINRWESEN